MSLALMVVRPTLREAVDELKLLMTDYIENVANPERNPEDIKRRMPSEVWEAHTDLFCEVLGDNSGEWSVDWECGSIVVSKDGVITLS